MGVMVQINTHSKIFLVTADVDMRKGFNGLWAFAQTKLGAQPRSESVFVFTNKARTRIKVLAWDRTGVWVCAKRLEKGTFAWPHQNNSGVADAQDAADSRAKAGTQGAKGASGGRVGSADSGVHGSEDCGGGGAAKVLIEPSALFLLLDGVDMRDACRRPWFERD
jgi:transposase